MQNNEAVLIVITGGTIDSYYDGTKDTVVPSSSSIIPEVVNSFKLDIPISYAEVCMKDSRSLADGDIDEIIATIESADQEHIVVTHGTYTMPDTARILKANLQRKDQTIILTGSMIPIKGFSPSDGTFNLGFSLAKVGDLDPGIYVCMNGNIFSPEEVVKKISEGRFSSIFNQSQG